MTTSHRIEVVVRGTCLQNPGRPIDYKSPPGDRTMGSDLKLGQPIDGEMTYITSGS